MSHSEINSTDLCTLRRLPLTLVLGLVHSGPFTDRRRRSLSLGPGEMLWYTARLLPLQISLVERMDGGETKGGREEEGREEGYGVEREEGGSRWKMEERTE